MEGSTNRTTILIVILLIVAFFSYMFFFKGDGEVSTGITTEAEKGVVEEVSTLLATLEPIRISNGIFVDPVFLSLTNFNLEVVQFPAGRVNPFAPIGL